MVLSDVDKALQTRRQLPLSHGKCEAGLGPKIKLVFLRLQWAIEVLWLLAQRVCVSGPVIAVEGIMNGRGTILLCSQGVVAAG